MPLVITRRRTTISNEAAKYDQAEEHEKAAHHAYLAHGLSQNPVLHDVEAAKLHAEQCNSTATLASEPARKEKIVA